MSCLFSFLVSYFAYVALDCFVGLQQLKYVETQYNLLLMWLTFFLKYIGESCPYFFLKHT